MTAQAGCDLDCATSVGAQLNQRCACEVVDVFSLHESIRSAFTEFTADPYVPANLFSRQALYVTRDCLNPLDRVRARDSASPQNHAHRENVLHCTPATPPPVPGTRADSLGGES